MISSLYEFVSGSTNDTYELRNVTERYRIVMYCSTMTERLNYSTHWCTVMEDRGWVGGLAVWRTRHSCTWGPRLGGFGRPNPKSEGVRKFKIQKNSVLSNACSKKILRKRFFSDSRGVRKLRLFAPIWGVGPSDPPPKYTYRTRSTVLWSYFFSNRGDCRAELHKPKPHSIKYYPKYFTTAMSPKFTFSVERYRARPP